MNWRTISQSVFACCLLTGMLVFSTVARADDPLGEAVLIDVSGASHQGQIDTAASLSAKYNVVTIVANGGTVEQVANLQNAAGKAEKEIGWNILILRGTIRVADDTVFMTEIVVPTTTIIGDWEATHQDHTYVRQLIAAIGLTFSGGNPGMQIPVNSSAN